MRRKKRRVILQEAYADEESPVGVPPALGAVLIVPEILRFALSRPQTGIRSATAKGGS